MPKKNAEMLCVSREDAVALFKALDFKTAGRWNRKKLRSQLAGLAELIEDGFELEDEGLNDLLRAVIDAAKRETTIDVVEEKVEKDDEEEPAEVEEEEAEEAEEEDEEEEAEEEDEEEEAEEEDEDEEASAKPKKPKKEKGPKKGAISAEKDWAGNKKGSQASDINMAVQKLAKAGGFTCKQIAAETHLPSARVAGHMAYLIKKGVAVKTDRGVHELVSK